MGSNTNKGGGPDLIHGYRWLTPGLENFLLASELLICNIHVSLKTVKFGKPDNIVY